MHYSSGESFLNPVEKASLGKVGRPNQTNKTYWCPFLNTNIVRAVRAIFRVKIALKKKKTFKGACRTQQKRPGIVFLETGHQHDVNSPREKQPCQFFAIQLSKTRVQKLGRSEITFVSGTSFVFFRVSSFSCIFFFWFAVYLCSPSSIRYVDETVS